MYILIVGNKTLKHYTVYTSNYQILPVYCWIDMLILAVYLLWRYICPRLDTVSDRHK